MASQSLYRKWRSQTFSDFVGQEHVVRTLKNALKDGKLSHAYLFTGPRGTGKTTTARLLAKTINCLHPVDNEPCNECQQCREITAGNSFNVVEIDAASNRGIDSIRELREKVMVPPSTGKYKVYILDEAHMLTVEAFNALLKTLEEPPPHAIFVMATTDVHKMLPTVLSRCQRFDFKRFTLRQIVEHLSFVAEQEQVQLEPGAVELIARAAAGGMRDALSLLDQAIAYSGNVISLVQVQSMLGIADPRAIQKFILHIANLDSSADLHLIHELAEAGADLRQINTQVAEYWRAMMLCSAGANIGEILDSTEDEIREITEAARLFDLEELIECSRIFAQNDLMQKNQSTPQLGLELALLSCVELHRRAQAGQPLTASSSVVPARSQSPSVPPASSVPARTAATQQQAPRVSPPPQETRVVPPSVPVQAPSVAHEPSRIPDQKSEAPARNGRNAEVSFSLPPSAQEIKSVQSDPGSSSSPVSDGQSTDDPPPFTVAQVKEKWEYVKRRVKTKKDGAMVAALLNDYTVVLIEGSGTQPVVVIQALADFHYKAIHKSESKQKLIEWALKIELGQECRIRLLPPGQPVPPSPPPSLPRSQEGGNGSTPPPPPALPRNSGGGSATLTMPPVAPTQVVSPLERPVSIQLPAAALPGDLLLADTQAPAASILSSSAPASPLARMESVRENSNRASSPPEGKVRSAETRQTQVEHKAKADPVVQEVMRMFKAQIKEIHLK
jgi:DNA polymerase-3 subunit gamma/tau